MKETIINLIKSGELDRLTKLKYYSDMGLTRAEVRRERKHAKEYKAIIDEYLASGNKLEDIPLVPLVCACNCLTLLKSACLLYKKGGGKDEQ